MACSALRAVELLRDDPSLVERLRRNTTRFRSMLVQAGFAPIPGDAAIIPIVLGIYGYTYGSVLGIFLAGMLTRSRGNNFGNVLAMIELKLRRAAGQ